MIALIAFIVTMLPLSAFAEARTSFIRSQIDSRPARPDSGIEIVPHKTENPKRSAIWDGSIAAGFAGGSGTEDDPYLISNGSELAYLAQQVNSGNRYENTQHASDLRLFLWEPRSLAHRAHQSKSRLRRLATSVELDHGLAGGSRLKERLGLRQRGHRLVARQTLEPLHEVAGRLEAVPSVHHVDNLRAAVLEYRLAHAHQRLDVP